MRVTTSHNPLKARWVFWRPGWVLPERFSAEVDAEESPFLLDLELRFDGPRVECAAVRFRERDGGEPVTPRAIRRVRLMDYIRQAVATKAMQVEDAGAGTRLGFQSDEAWEDAYAAAVPPRRHKGKITDEHLRRVAEVYREAEPAGRPRQAVQEMDGGFWGPGTAARWIRQARDRGFLAEPKRGGRERGTRSEKG